MCFVQSFFLQCQRMYSGISVYNREVAQSILYKTIKSALLSRQSNQWEIDLSHSFTHQLEKIALN